MEILRNSINIDRNKYIEFEYNKISNKISEMIENERENINNISANIEKEKEIINKTIHQ